MHEATLTIIHPNIAWKESLKKTPSPINYECFETFQINLNMSPLIYRKLTWSFSTDDWIIRQNFVISAELGFWHLPFSSALKWENLSEFVSASFCFGIVSITANRDIMLVRSCSIDLYIGVFNNGHLFCEGSSFVNGIFSSFDIFMYTSIDKFTRQMIISQNSYIQKWITYLFYGHKIFANWAIYFVMFRQLASIFTHHAKRSGMLWQVSLITFSGKRIGKTVFVYIVILW